MRSPHAQHPVIPVHLTAGTLTPRPWVPGDAAVLTGLFRDEALRRWTSGPVCDETGAARWVAEQQRGRETGDRLAFAVEEARAPGAGIRPTGHVALKRPAPESGSAEVGYWTAAHARGRAVAPRALRALTHGAFTAFAHEGPARPELLHQAGDTASCRVAGKCGFALVGLLPAAPPASPREGRLHVREAAAAG